MIFELHGHAPRITSSLGGRLGGHLVNFFEMISILELLTAFLLKTTFGSNEKYSNSCRTTWFLLEASIAARKPDGSATA